jgi:hypothetical protein
VTVYGEPRRGSNREARRQAKDLVAGMHGPWTPWVQASPDGMRNGVTTIYRNNYFTVLERPVRSRWGTVLHLMVRRHDQKAIPNHWATLQRIKDELTSPATTAVEVYPSRADLVDQAPMYHLWCLPPDVVLPFGLHLWGREEAQP